VVTFAEQLWSLSPSGIINVCLAPDRPPTAGFWGGVHVASGDTVRR
jgi:hypothetical protein